MEWVDAIRFDDHTKDSFLRYLNELDVEATHEMEEAKDFNQVLEARGRKKAIRDLRNVITLQEQEEKSYADFQRQNP